MRYLLTIFLSVLILAGCQSLGSPGYRIDPQATAQAQWKPGEVIAEGEVYWWGIEEYNFYRKFIGITDQGYAVVQDFYADSGNKFTDPYVVMQPERIGDIRLLYKEMNNSSSAMLDGELTLWYENGQKKSEGNYQDGEKQGLWTYWHENGQKAFEGNYLNGEGHGLCTFWHENGQKREERHYQDGERQGLWTAWYENGQKWVEGYFQDDLEQGIFTEWDENGKKINETLYEAGEVVRETDF